MSEVSKPQNVPEYLLRLREGSAETRFIRSGGRNGGDAYHVRGCSRAGRMWIPWSWPDTNAMRPIEIVDAAPWLKPCSYCLPELRSKWKYQPEPEYV